MSLFRFLWLAAWCGAACAADPNLQTITITGGRPSSLPTQIPTTLEGITGAQIQESINATDSEDALKYLPSLLVRKRYIGDYNHAVLATRASGTGNSARSLVYADGVLLSNLLGNGATYTPRWGAVTPEEIERVDVLYGPFSAAYPGNSVGAVVDYITRMPTQFEGHAQLQAFSENFKLYSTDQRYGGHQASASLGNQSGPWSWWANVNQLDSTGQPLTFPNALVSSGTVSALGTPVTGAIAGKSPKNQDWLLLGTGTQYHTTQDHAKLKLAYDLSPTVRASYLLGYWHNQTTNSVSSYLRDAAGNAIYSGSINVDGRQYTLGATTFQPSLNRLEHYSHALSVQSHTQSHWDWEVAASMYDYQGDLERKPTTAPPAALTGGAGTITDLHGTGWNTLALKGIWRSEGKASSLGHIVEFGYQRDAFALRQLTSNTTDWINGAAGSRSSAFTGNTTLQSVWAQDAWRWAPRWKTVLGARLEGWQAFNGSQSNANVTTYLGSRSEVFLSPKAALSYQATPLWQLKASLGRAVRMPTVTELYQGGFTGNTLLNNDPNLKPEKSWTTEWTAERDLSGTGLLRATLFHERTQDALYSQTNVTVSPNVTNIQNVDRIHTTGLELAYQASNVGLKGLDVSASLTHADSRIVQNDQFPASVGQRQPRVPDWRSSLVATYKPDAQWAYTLGARYSGQQFGTLDNTDPNGFAYTGFSKFFVVDARVQYQLSKQITATLGIDNLNNYKYWAFHPYTQRTYSAQIKLKL